MEINRSLLNNGDLFLPTKIVPVPWLRPIFTGLNNGEVPTLTIRALSANEFYLAKEEQLRYGLRATLQKAVAEAIDVKTAIEDFLKITGDQERTSETYAFRCKVFEMGVIGPDGKSLFNEFEVRRIGQFFALPLGNVSEQILELMSEGPRVGE